MPELGRFLLVAGLAIAAVGAWLAAGGRLPPLGRLPGDLVFQRGGMTVFIPITTMVLISLALTIVLRLLAAIRR